MSVGCINNDYITACIEQCGYSLVSVGTHADSRPDAQAPETVL